MSDDIIDENFRVSIDDEGLWITTEEAMWQIEPEEALRIARKIFERFTTELTGN